jgi:hypothetical protein
MDNIEIKYGSNLLTNPQSIANKFNSHFIDIIVELKRRTKLPDLAQGSPRLIKALELVCTAMVQGGNVVSALGSTQQYSRRKYMPLKHVSWRI